MPAHLPATEFRQGPSAALQKQRTDGIRALVAKACSFASTKLESSIGGASSSAHLQNCP